jgi:hypothetical protein
MIIILYTIQQKPLIFRTERRKRVGGDNDRLTSTSWVSASIANRIKRTHECIIKAFPATSQNHRLHLSIYTYIQFDVLRFRRQVGINSHTRARARDTYIYIFKSPSLYIYTYKYVPCMHNLLTCVYIVGTRGIG